MKRPYYTNNHFRLQTWTFSATRGPVIIIYHGFTFLNTNFLVRRLSLQVLIYCYMCRKNIMTETGMVIAAPFGLSIMTDLPLKFQ